MSDYMNRVGQPVPTHQRANTNGLMPQQFAGKVKKFSLRGKGFRVLTAVLLACITFLLVALVAYLFIYGNGKSDLAEVKPSQYQAVFINNSSGQEFWFGKLSELNKDYFKLTDIFYVRVTTIQPSNSSEQKQDISLAKLGFTEIHGPEDAMYIAKQEVKYWENLKEEGTVVCAIRKYQIDVLKLSGITRSAQCDVAVTPTPTPAE
jgi:hypothetical protein